jgi:hypothetical protein
VDPSPLVSQHINDQGIFYAHMKAATDPGKVRSLTSASLQLQHGSELTTLALAERVTRTGDLDATDDIAQSVVFKVVPHAERLRRVGRPDVGPK